MHKAVNRKPIAYFDNLKPNLKNLSRKEGLLGLISQIFINLQRLMINQPSGMG